jgi:membrane associated rhomboid family serine protease
MPRIGATPLTFPSFHGATRLLVLTNLAAYFLLLIAGVANHPLFNWLFVHAAFLPTEFLHGWLWQPLTYSLVQIGITSTLFGLMSLWFLGGFLENFHTSNWVLGLYAASVVGTALAGAVIYLIGAMVHYDLPDSPLYGSFGGIFGILVAIGIMYGNTEFMLFPLPISIKARYLAIIYSLVAIAMLFGPQGVYAFAQLGGAFAGWVYLRRMPRRGFPFIFSEQWYGLRNRFYRWKRRRAARKFEVYMRRQGRTVRFDGQGRPIEEDQDDKSRWN